MLARVNPDAPLPETWVAFDVETTGLYPGPDRIIEVAAVRFTRGDETGAFASLVNPGKRLPGIITRITGLTDADVAAAPPIGEVLGPLLAFIGAGPLLSHNVPFDLGFLLQALVEAGRPRPPVPMVDTLEIARTLAPEAPNHKLQTLLARFGIDPEGAHRAAEDARSAYRLFEKLLAAAGPPKTWGELARLGPIASLDQPLPAVPPGDAATAERIEAALRGGADLRIRYTDARGAVSERTVAPKGLVPYNGSLQLLAFCYARREDRQFRLDRMEILALQERTE